jgi:hypothetical protein
MVPGTIADLFHAKDRGSAMNLFALMIFAGQVSQAIVSGIELTSLVTRWCSFWVYCDGLGNRVGVWREIVFHHIYQ